MIQYVCDRCAGLIEKGRVRYILRVELFAAYDGLEIHPEELAQRNLRAEIQQLLDQCAELTEQELMDQVYVKVSYDLCPRCQKELAPLLRDPTHLLGSAS